MNRKLSLISTVVLIFSAFLLSLSVQASRHAYGSRVFVFSPRSLSWVVYNGDGSVVRSGHAVGGRGYCPDLGRSCHTPVGTFRVYSKAGPYFKSSRFPLPYGGAPMPWAMFFHRGFAIHGSNEVPNYNASHGCIRVHPSDARWLNTEGLPMGTRVVVKSY